MLYGKKLNWVKNSGELVNGISQGPDHNGVLLVLDAFGELHEVISGDVQLAGKLPNVLKKTLEM